MMTILQSLQSPNIRGPSTPMYSGNISRPGPHLTTSKTFNYIFLRTKFHFYRVEERIFMRTIHGGPAETSGSGSMRGGGLVIFFLLAQYYKHL